MRAFAGSRESDIWRDSLRAFSSSSSMQVSTTIRKIGGTAWWRLAGQRGFFERSEFRDEKLDVEQN